MIEEHDLSAPRSGMERRVTESARQGNCHYALRRYKLAKSKEMWRAKMVAGANHAGGELRVPVTRLEMCRWFYSTASELSVDWCKYKL